eukprot:IDg10239t1
MRSSETSATAICSAPKMQCILANGFGQPDDVLSKGELPRPFIEPGSGKLLIKVHACGLTPGDYRMLTGAAKFVKKPANGFPYIPGLDVTGTVMAVDAHKSCAGFVVGDEVVATWDICGEGGMAEYALVDGARSVHRPDSVGSLEGAALANSASHALKAVREARIKAGDRILVLGGSGGVGSAAVQLARHAGAAFVAATSTDEAFLRSIGVDRPIDYTKEDWSAVPELSQNKLDVVIDCAEGKRAWFNPRLHDVLKRGTEGGRFVAVVHNEWDIQVNSWLGLPGLLAPPIWRALSSRMWRPTPIYTMHLDGPDQQSMKEVLDLAAIGKLRAPLHDGQSFPFTEQGAKAAFNLHFKRRGHGKIVMEISKTA